MCPNNTVNMFSSLYILLARCFPVFLVFFCLACLSVYRVCLRDFIPFYMPEIKRLFD